jgi:hypothetical protein
MIKSWRIFWQRVGADCDMTMKMRALTLRKISVAVALLTVGTLAIANDLVIEAPPSVSVSSASATAEQMQTTAQGTISGSAITFANLLPATPYSVSFQLADGRSLQGVDLSWYDAEQLHHKPAPLTGDDFHEIQQIINVPSFYDKSTIIAFNGNHDRVTLLVQLLRDSAFHSDKGGEVIWRMELWYFKNEFGGWMKVPQQNVVLRRERYTNEDAYQQATGKIIWQPVLGGITLGKNQPTTTLSLKPTDLTPPPATAPTGGPDNPNDPSDQ